MDGLKSLFRSRKVLIALVALLGVLLSHYADLPLEVQAAIVALAYALIDGISKEDAAEKAGQTAIVRERLTHYVGGRSDAAE
jgi:hydrogenase/urease accessory protein HupE